MEIGTHLPFLTQEDYNSLFQDIITNNPNNNNNMKKRNAKDNHEPNQERQHKQQKQNNNTNNIKDILASLLLLEQEETNEQQNRLLDSQQHKAMFNSNFKNQTQTMNNYMEQLQSHYTELDQSHHTKSKTTRLTAIAAASSIASGSDQPGSTQTGSDSKEINHPHQRRLWVKDRSNNWWENCNRENFPEDEFRRCFRMSKSTFNMICNELDSSVTKKNTTLREAIPVRQRVAVCLYRLATGDPLRLVSKKFGLGISTCHKLVLEVCSAIRTVLMPKFLRWPDEETMQKTKRDFEGIFGIPNVGGTMYTTHIPIIAPKVNVALYYNKKHTERNQKTSYSITVQGVVNSKGVFNDVCIGWPGSMPDSEVLEKSALYERAKRGNLKDIWIVGNSGYPVLDWVLVPYKHKNLTWTQHGFNEKIEEIERVGKEAFGRLKGRWGCLQKRTEIKLQDLPIVLGACCVLHNVCEIMNEEMDDEWKFDVFDDENVVEDGVCSVSSLKARDQHFTHSLSLSSSSSIFLSVFFNMTKMSCLLGLSLSFLFVALVASSKFEELFQPGWAMDHFVHEGDLLKLKLDNYSGAGFGSKSKYMFGKVTVQLKLVEGDSAGTVTAFYMSSEGPTHNEFDFEFLGNTTGEPYSVQTNVYVNGVGNREQRLNLWFDPSKDFHTYSIFWNQRQVVFLVDETPIRVHTNLEHKGIPFPKDQAMGVYSSIWNADDWATQGGRVKTDWSHAPFVATYKDFEINACECPTPVTSIDNAKKCSSSEDKKFWWDEPMLSELTLHQSHQLIWVRANHMVYDYCADTARFPVIPAECVRHHH